MSKAWFYIAAGWAFFMVTLAMLAVMPPHWTTAAWAFSSIQWTAAAAGVACFAVGVWKAWKASVAA